MILCYTIINLGGFMETGIITKPDSLNEWARRAAIYRCSLLPMKTQLSCVIQTQIEKYAYQYYSFVDNIVKEIAYQLPGVILDGKTELQKLDMRYLEQQFSQSEYISGSSIFAKPVYKTVTGVKSISQHFNGYDEETGKKIATHFLKTLLEKASTSLMSILNINNYSFHDQAAIDWNQGILIRNEALVAIMQRLIETDSQFGISRAKIFAHEIGLDFDYINDIYLNPKTLPNEYIINR